MNIQVHLYREQEKYMNPLHLVRHHQPLSLKVASVVEHMRNMYYSYPEFKRECKDGFRVLTEDDFPKKLV